MQTATRHLLVCLWKQQDESSRYAGTVAGWRLTCDWKHNVTVRGTWKQTKHYNEVTGKDFKGVGFITRMHPHLKI
jgi:hypothetical protein